MAKTNTLGATLIVSGSLLLVGVTFLLFVFPVFFNSPTHVYLGSGDFKAELALTQATREKGLSNRASLEADRALLMAFPNESKWGIWMKDMQFPLDIVWLDSNKKVVYIVKNAPFIIDSTNTYTPKNTAQFVVELPAGSVDKYGININTVAVFDIDMSGVK